MFIYSIYDRKAEIFNTPFFCRNDSVALRSFEDLLKDDRTTVSQHPEDFVLYKLGQFNDENGQVVNDGFASLIDAFSVMKQMMKAAGTNPSGEDRDLAEKVA